MSRPEREESVESQATMTIEQVPAADWRRWTDDHSATILDVREPHEWSATGVLPGSTLISLGALPRSLGDIDANQPVLVVCRAGNRSQVAAGMLIRSGFSKVANLSGGLAAVVSA